MKRLISLTAVFIILVISSVYAAQEPGKDRVTAGVEKEEGRDILSFSNSTPCEITLTVKITDLENAQVNVPLPYTAVIPQGEKMRAAAVSPLDPSKPFTYKYQFQWRYGSPKTVADQRISYLLPYKPGTAHMVMQAYNGDFTHMGDGRYAIDWKMPTGTEICAARGGTVIEVCDIYDGGGTTAYYLRRANYILIRHPDGTIAEYGHIQRGGAKFTPGQQVQAREVIALSGNVGYSQGPHLHFDLFIPVDGTRIKTIPVQFKTKISDNSTVMTGDEYEAP